MRDWPPPSVERLHEGVLGSVGSVELLLRLRADGDRPHTVEELCVTLESPANWTERELATLARARLVSRDDGTGWRYSPATTALATAVDDLAEAWQRDSRAVSRWVFAPRRRRSRRRTVR